VQYNLNNDVHKQDLSLTNDDIGLTRRDLKNIAGKTLKWAGSDSHALFEQNIKNPETYKKLKLYGWLDPDCISYKYNKYGFRCDEFDDRAAGIALGCSHTEGTGLPEQSSWPSVLSKLLGIHVWNLGVGAVSLDTVFRLLDYWLPKLSPKFVTICIPSTSRVEVFQNKTPINLGPWPIDSQTHEYYYKVWNDSDINRILLRKKNLLAIQQLCNTANTKLIMLDSYLIANNGSGMTARDLKHFGVQNHEYFAQQIYKNVPTELKQ